MKQLYLSLAILGAVVPYIFFFSFFAEEGVSLPTFIGALFVNGAAGGFVADLLITSVAFWAFLVASRTPRPWIYIGLNLTIGLSCALPAWLYVQERAKGDSAS